MSASAVEVFENIPKDSWVTTGELAAETSVSRRMVRRYLERFEEEGVIDRQRCGEGRAAPARRTANTREVVSHEDASRSEPAAFQMLGGYEYSSCTLNESDAIGIHRLVAIAEYGIDAVAGNDIHHKNGISWDNRPSNLQPLPSGDHFKHHTLRGIISSTDDQTLASILRSEGYSNAAKAIDEK